MRKRIVELEKFEAWHKQSEENYKTILQPAMDGFWLVDTRGHLLGVNDAYCRMTGYSRDELLNMQIQDVEAMETPEETARHIRRVMEVGWDRFETRHRCKNGKIIDIEVAANYLKRNGGQFFAVLRIYSQPP